MRSSASSRAASRSRRTSRAACPASRSSGSPIARAQEAKHRVRSGIGSAQLEWPLKRITVNLAPAGLRKEGSGFDLSIALAVLAASRQIPPSGSPSTPRSASSRSTVACGRCAGRFAVAEGARRAGLERILCAPESACEAELARRRGGPGPAPRRGRRVPARRAPPAAGGAARRGGGARSTRPGRRPRPGARSPRARARRRGRSQPAARRPARNGQDDARTPAAVDPAAARAARGARGDADPFGRRCALARAAADHAAAVPGTASQCVDGGDRRRRLRPAAGRGEPRASGRAAARRAAGVPAARARGAAPAARGRRRVGRPRPGARRSSRPGSSSSRR